MKHFLRYTRCEKLLINHFYNYSDTQLARLKNQSTFFLSGSSHKPNRRRSYFLDRSLHESIASPAIIAINNPASPDASSAYAEVRALVDIAEKCF